MGVKASDPAARPAIVGISTLGRGVRIYVRKQAVFDVARGVSNEDNALRARLTGRPVEQIREEAARAFARQGVNLSGMSLEDYARSVADGSDYRFVVAF